MYKKYKPGTLIYFPFKETWGVILYMEHSVPQYLDFYIVQWSDYNETSTMSNEDLKSTSFEIYEV